MPGTRSLEGALQSLAKKIETHPGPLGVHRIRLRVNGDGGGVWTLRTGPDGVRLEAGEGGERPTLEVIAEADAIRPVLEGKMDGRAAFLKGGIRVRGDVPAAERLSAALGTHMPGAAPESGRRG